MILSPLKGPSPGGGGLAAPLVRKGNIKEFFIFKFNKFLDFSQRFLSKNQYIFAGVS